MLEREYKPELIGEIRSMFPGCLILNNDSERMQGVPDLLILFEDCWAALEVKASRTAPRQPNQEYYVDRLNEMSFAAFIYPEIEEEVLDALQQALRPRRSARIS